jgi:hypothetical protein
MQSERAVPWADLTPDEQADFARQYARPGEGARDVWDAQPAPALWRFYAGCLDARIAEAPDGVEADEIAGTASADLTVVVKARLR